MLKEGMPLVNIKRAEITEEGQTPKTYRFDTATEADVNPFASEGREEILRVKNRIISIDKTEDLVVGYNITLTDSVLIPEVLALVDGGTLRTQEAEVIGYDGPPAGQEVVRKPFTLTVYTEEKDASGDTVQYAKFTFRNCKGTPVKYTMKEGEFFVPQFMIKSRPKNGENPISIDFIEQLPV